MDDMEWKPPSDAELKVIQARRERQDKISKIMGEYLLKGYKMLGTVCSKCETILMQDKQGRNYCIACNELDSDADKDDPVLNRNAAKRLEAEQCQRTDFSDYQDEETTPLGSDSGNAGPLLLSPQIRSHAPSQAAPSGLLRESPTSSLPEQKPSLPEISPARHREQSARKRSLHLGDITSVWDMTRPMQVVNSKLRSATEELASKSNAAESLELCRLIRECAEALDALHRIHSVSK